MPETYLLTLAFSLIAVFFGLLMAIIGWMGNKLYNKVDEITKTLQDISAELHNRITDIDKRLTSVEVHTSMCSSHRKP